MLGKNSKAFLLIWLFSSATIEAQDPANELFGEEDYLYQEESKEIPQELFERYVDLGSEPININCASRDQLIESGLFSAFQLHTLLKYREEFGDLYSIYELATLTGFSLSRLQDMAPYLRVDPCSKITTKARTKHLVLLNAGTSFPEKEEETDSSRINSGSGQSGHSIRTDFRIKSQFANYFSLGFTYEKDEGEAFLYKHKPEFLSGYLQYRGSRFVRQLVIGNYKLNQGLGLVNGTGFLHSPEGFQADRHSLLMIRPYSSKGESGYERGLGLRLAIRHLQIMTWASYRRIDLSTKGIVTGREGISWKEQIRETGLHRTQGETEGRNLAYRFHSGLQGLYKKNNLDLGAALGLESMGFSRVGIETLELAIGSAYYPYISLHGKLNKDKWLLFTELALTPGSSSALLTGVNLQINDFMQGLLLLHRYGLNYMGSYSASYAFGSKIENERGIAVHLQLEPAQRLQAHFTAEVFSFPGPRYQTAVPSSAYRYSLIFRNGGISEFQWRIRLSKKKWQLTPAQSQRGLGAIQSNETTRLDLRFICDLKIQWQSRMVFAWGSPTESPYPGVALVQQFSFQAQKLLKSTLQFVVFDVKDWNQRIYLYEPGLYYDFSFPVCYGSGQKIAITQSLKLFKKLSLAGKLAYTSYQDRKAWENVNEVLNETEKWLFAVQLRLNL